MTTLLELSTFEVFTHSTFLKTFALVALLSLFAVCTLDNYYDKKKEEEDIFNGKL